MPSPSAARWPGRPRLVNRAAFQEQRPPALPPSLPSSATPAGRTPSDFGNQATLERTKGSAPASMNRRSVPSRAHSVRSRPAARPAAAGVLPAATGRRVERTAIAHFVGTSRTLPTTPTHSTARPPFASRVQTPQCLSEVCGSRLVSANGAETTGTPAPRPAPGTAPYALDAGVSMVRPQASAMDEDHASAGARSAPASLLHPRAKGYCAAGATAPCRPQRQRRVERSRRLCTLGRCRFSPVRTAAAETRRGRQPPQRSHCPRDPVDVVARLAAAPRAPV